MEQPPNKPIAVKAMIDTVSFFYEDLQNDDKGFFRDTFLQHSKLSKNYFYLLISKKGNDPKISTLRALKKTYELTKDKINAEIAEMYLINDSAHELTA